MGKGCLTVCKYFLCLYFTCLLLILLAQIEANVFIYVQKKTLDDGMLDIISKVMENYPGNSSSLEQAWDIIQKNMQCCGWRDHKDWFDNGVISSSSQQLFPCSCQNLTLTSRIASDSGFCETPADNWPVYRVGCATSVENWFLTNIGVAFIELLGIILSICLCKGIRSEDVGDIQVAA